MTSMQTHYRLAAALGMPVATDMVSFSVENEKAVVICEVGGGCRVCTPQYAGGSDRQNSLAEAIHRLRFVGTCATFCRL